MKTSHASERLELGYRTEHKTILGFRHSPFQILGFRHSPLVRYLAKVHISRLLSVVDNVCPQPKEDNKVEQNATQIHLDRGLVVAIRQSRDLQLGGI